MGGWRFRKTKTAGPFRATVSRRGAGGSFGFRGLRITRSSTGRWYATVSLPGTGLSRQFTLVGGRAREREYEREREREA
ncbi:MAG TPA: DUF4236 domain-containing protein [Actinomycetes bacterium]|nr:DUF4236 domain-containing protein [Actinomycetes bacterium]